MEIKIAATEEEREAVFALRHLVFVEEQGVSPKIERDAEDAHALHILAETDGTPVGCARLLVSGNTAHIGRLAVRKELRGRGIGAKICRFLIDYCQAEGYLRIGLHSQYHAIGFYEKLGFKPHGEAFEEAGIKHIEMMFFGKDEKNEVVKK